MNRFINMIYAHLFGYFWAKCPVCNNYFGGHETNDAVSLYYGFGEGSCVCKNCTKETIDINIKNGFMREWQAIK